MGKTSIEWTDASWNPVTGCREISPGCANCYAARLAATRLKRTPAYKGLAVFNSKLVGPRWTGEIRLQPDRLDEPTHWRKPRRIFVCDMADLFHEDVPTEFIARVWGIMAACRQHTFQVLTKRPKRMRLILSAAGNWQGWITHTGKEPVGYAGKGIIMGAAENWPLRNVWIGTSVENQHFADLRIPDLLQTPAAVRFISAEPLLGPLDLTRLGPDGSPAAGWNALTGEQPCCHDYPETILWNNHLDWVIAGGESGHTARPMHPDWVRSLHDQCSAARVPFFFKQWGEWAEWIPAFSTETARYMRADDGSLHHEPIYSGATGRPIVKVGKRKAGRLLGGKEWSEFPETKG